MSGRLFAVGDVHGHLAKLEALLAKLPLVKEEDDLVFLGDYIDRGPDSRGVVDRLLELRAQGFRLTCLTGNHEAMLLDHYLHHHGLELWLANGGLATLRSYARPGQDPLIARPPQEHLVFYGDLELIHRAQGTIFVHAGLRPGVALEEQDPQDLLWIREEFFLGENDRPERIVFGHTPFREPFRRDGDRKSVV
jgi:serine/threonine protein phosphatase 1